MKNPITGPEQHWKSPNSSVKPTGLNIPPVVKHTTGAATAAQPQRSATPASIPQPRQPGNSAYTHPDTNAVPAPPASTTNLVPQTSEVPMRSGAEPTPHQRTSDLRQEWSFIGSYRKSYSLYERSNGLTLVHSSRALRRIGYEQVLADLQSHTTTVQKEIVPSILELDAPTSTRLKKWLATLNKCGIQVEEFGRNFFRIEAVPSLMTGDETKTLLEKWLHQEGSDAALNLETSRTDIALLCSSKYRRQLELPLREEVAFDILKQLLRCDQPMVDPEGKTIVHHIPHRLLDGSSFKSLEEI